MFWTNRENANFDGKHQKKYHKKSFDELVQSQKLVELPQLKEIYETFLNIFLIWGTYF